MTEKKISWDDIIRVTRRKYGPLVAILSNAALYHVILNAVVEADKEGSGLEEADDRLARVIRDSDSFIDLVFEDEIYNSEGIPKRTSMKKFLNEIAPHRREQFRQSLKNGEKISFERLLKTAQKVMDRFGRYPAIIFSLYHIGVADISGIPTSGKTHSEEWFKEQLEEAMVYDAEKALEKQGRPNEPFKTATAPLLEVSAS